MKRLLKAGKIQNNKGKDVKQSSNNLKLLDGNSNRVSFKK